MALVASVHVDLDWTLPDIALSDTAGTRRTLQDQAGENGLLVAFTCNHCPYAIAVWPRLIRHAASLKQLGIATVAINPNIHPDYPADNIEAMRDKVADWGIDFPYLADEQQTAAKIFDAQCTPDIYLFNGQGKLFYHGRIDDSWKDEAKVRHNELISAAAMMVDHKAPPQPQHPTIGCSIKWLDESSS